MAPRPTDVILRALRAEEGDVVGLKVEREALHRIVLTVGERLVEVNRQLGERRGGAADHLDALRAAREAERF